MICNGSVLGAERIGLGKQQCYPGAAAAPLPEMGPLFGLLWGQLRTTGLTPIMHGLRVGTCNSCVPGQGLDGMLATLSRLPAAVPGIGCGVLADDK